MMTDDNNVTLAFLGRQMERMIEEQGRVRDSIDVLTGIVIRMEGAVNGLTLEIAGLRSMVLRHDRDIRTLKEGA
jgi:predicted RNA-binding protein Jag